MTSLTRTQIWWRLLLYPGHTLPTAAAPILVAAGLALHDRTFATAPVALAFLASWLVHVAGVFTDNFVLLLRHPTLEEHPELLEALADRRLVLTTLRLAIAICLALAAMAGGWLIWIGGPVALAIGALGIIASLSYHGGPWPYAPRGWAEPVFFVMFAWVAVPATYYVAAVSHLQPPGPWLDRAIPVPLTTFLVGVPVGALVTNVLIIDDLRDRRWDALKGWRTGAVRWGASFSRAEFTLLMVSAYLAPIVLAYGVGFGPVALIPLATLPLGLAALKAIWRLEEPRALVPWTPRMASLGLYYAALEALGLAFGHR